MRLVLPLAAAVVPLTASAARGQTAAAGGGTSRQAVPTAPAACNVEGVWQLESSAVNGGAQQPVTGWAQRKIVANGHYIWLGRDDKRDTLPLRTAADTLRMQQLGGGAGTYTTSGNTYTERADYFYIPQMEGQSIATTCRTTGDRWEIAFTVTPVAAFGGGPPVRVVEIWRRLK